MWNKIGIATLLAMALVACGKGNAYVGTYKGTIPAADAHGIEVTLEITKDGSFALQEQFVGEEAVHVSKGTYTVSGDVLTLVPAGEITDYNPSRSYTIEQNRLRMLDTENQPITGVLADYYILTKTVE